MYCSSTISGHANILNAHEGQLEDFNLRLRSFEVDYSSNLMISGLENIDNPNVDLKRMVVMLANFLNLNITKFDISKARVVKNPNNSSIVQVTFYSSCDYNFLI